MHDNTSNKFADWTTEKLKREAEDYYQTIHVLECFAMKDLMNYDNIMSELHKRRVYMKVSFQ